MPDSVAWFPRSRRAPTWRRWGRRCAAQWRRPGVDKPDIVAATIGPGLAGALLVGVAAAKAYSAAWQVPFYAVNHLGGHLAADVYDHGPLPESVGLLVSGGHTNLLHVRSLGEPIVELGSTVDDAAGEAYDKVARLLGLGYPGARRSTTSRAPATATRSFSRAA